ncbi:MAG: thiamine diphosphokinase [Anaerolineae bacterium]|nr:thiamine diphosphokinase [Anaerolineae bacterium]MDW8173897.1 thiamine diphosphokinase [Anaerolineae bacterium]
MHCLIFANGEPNDGPMVQRALAEAQTAETLLVLAADGGARLAAYFGYVPQVIIGDMDSISAQQLAALEVLGAQISRYPTEKDATDLELAFIHAVQRGARWIRVIGAIGSRLDQVMANVYLLALDILRPCDVQIVADKQATRLLHPGTHTILGQAGDTVSLIPMADQAEGIRTEGLYYPLDNERLVFGPTRGVSNVMQASEARVSLRSGKLLLVHTVGRA